MLHGMVQYVDLANIVNLLAQWAALAANTAVQGVFTPSGWLHCCDDVDRSDCKHDLIQD